ncbi:MAG TPA: type IX secretion system membrane protein PorP/SprF, partial [Chitinophagales bacterium]|nr:type IX secretion system membrane protein PorP/SprF [Chitinophagales bacterium]
VGVMGQSEPQFTQYMYNKYLFNPAYAGSYNGFEIALLHRSQYVSLADKVIATEGFNFNIPISIFSSGVGITAINDLIGLQRSTYVSLDYDYRKNFKWGKMGVGVGVGIIQTALDGSQLRAPDGTYTNGNVNHNDSYLPNTFQNGIAPDLSLGVYFNNDRYFAGASINHIAFATAKLKTTSGTTDINFGRNLFFMGGYDFSVGRKLRIMPSAIVKTDLKEVQVDIGGNFTIIDNILTGISFRGYTKNTIDALCLTFGFRYRGFQLVYSYDANISYLTHFNTGSHEISLCYRYGFKSRVSKGYFYHNPRYD